MPWTVPVSPAPAGEESYLHYLARESRVALRWTVGISAAATALLLMTAFLPGAVIAAVILLVSYGLLLAASALEHRTHRPGDPDEDVSMEVEAAAAAAIPAEQVDQDEMREAVHKRQFKILAEIIIGVAALALVMAGFIFGWQFALLGAMIVFAYMLLVATPLWLGWVEDEGEEEAHRVEGQIHPEA